MRSSALHVLNLESHIGCKVLQNGTLNPFEALSASPSAQKTVKAEVNMPGSHENTRPNYTFGSEIAVIYVQRHGGRGLIVNLPDSSESRRRICHTDHSTFHSSPRVTRTSEESYKSMIELSPHHSFVTSFVLWSNSQIC